MCQVNYLFPNCADLTQIPWIMADLELSVYTAGPRSTVES